MKRLRLPFWLLTVLLAFVLFSCNSNPLTTPDDNATAEAALSLDKAYGGFETDDEAVAFNDAEMLVDFPEDEDVIDALNTDAELMTDLNSSSIKAFVLRITWGLLEGDSTATEIVDWSGSAEISRGTLLVLKTIRFEENDFIHLPRESRQKVDFTSFTKPHFDGLALAIIDNDTSAEEGTFTLNAGRFSRTLRFSELDSLDLLEPVGSGGHEVSLVSRTREYEPFAGGFLSGRWIKNRPNGGSFKGRWINSLGTNGGHLRGIWGINRNGEKVFYGKYISLNGRFKGLLAGQWEFDRDEEGGSFKGRWVNRSLTTVGTLAGHFKTGRPDDGRGFFHGRWKTVRSSDT